MWSSTHRRRLNTTTNKTNRVEKDASYEQLHAVQERLPKGHVVIEMNNLNAQVGSNNTLLAHLIEQYGLGDRSDNGRSFVDFCNFHNLVIRGILFEHRAYHKVSWISSGLSSNQIGRLGICSRFKSYSLDVRYKRGDISASRNGSPSDYRLR